MSASSGRPSVPRTTRNRSTVGSIDHVRSEVPWIRISPASVVGTARPEKRSVPTCATRTGASSCINGGPIRAARTSAMRSAGQPHARSSIYN
eukprot:1636191-Prymnesium_polylepis.1